MNTSSVVTLAAVGDVSTGHKPPESAFQYVTDMLRGADMRFAQVERLYTEGGAYQESCGCLNFEVVQPPDTAAVFASVPFDVLSLASNHSGDWGPEAIADTVDVFRKLGIPTIGAGHNISEARACVTIEKRGLRIAFLGYCSVLLPQFWANEQRAGCAPMRAHTFYEPYEYQPGSPAHVVTIPHREDLDALVADVRKAGKNADVVIVSLHWGLHFTAMPQEYQPIVAHAAIDAGASAVLGHHAHQQQGIEIYKGRPIFYALGNFAFHRRGGGHSLCMPDGRVTHQKVFGLEPDPGHIYDYRRHWNEGGVAWLDLDRNGVKHATYLPTLMNEKGQPQVVSPRDRQFEITRRYFEWLGTGIEGGLTRLDAEGERYLVYERGN
ncbi:MAG: CapA family protein [Betaproteobacteria bacterium]|nr:CapA family protein [Betaproteobacteria bacterium]